jgi:ATP/maltotriose-dependent transcriptional regulator MalT
VRELGLRRPEAASLLGLGEVAAAIGDVERAASLRGQALQIAVKIKAVPLALAILLHWADAFERKGDKERAAELYAFIADHESSKQSFVDRCFEMLANLASCLSAEEFEGAVAKGKGQTVEEIVKELLRENSLTQSKD